MATRVRTSGRATVVALGLVLALVLPSGPVAGQHDDGGSLAITEMTVESATSPLGIDRPRPRLGWVLESDERGQAQSAYQVQVATTSDGLAAGDADVWDSGVVESAESAHVAYDGPALQSRQRYHWRVRAWDADGRASAWSSPAWWEMGLLDPADWAAEPVGAPSAARQWADFALEVDFTLVTDAVGVFFRAQGAGDAYMWQVANFGGNPTLRPHARVGGTWSLLDEVAVDHVIAPDEFDGRTHRLRVEADGDTLRTYLNDEHVDTRSDATHAAGTIGFRTSGAETGLIHHMRVLEGDTLVFEEDFSAGNPFGGGTVADGSLEVSGNTEALLGAAQAMPLLRRDFTVDGDVERARVYATALGVYELRVNGERVGDHVFAPGWTDYDTRVQYQTHDVTDLLADGDNTIGGLLGEGWYAGHVGLAGRNVYGDQPFLLAQLEITYADGSTQTVVSDASWRSSDGPIRSSDMLMGEDYDARAEQPGWDTPGFDATDWQPVEVGDSDLVARLVAQVDEPVQVTEELDAVELTEPEPGTYVFDLGQNMVGNVRLRVDGGEAGDTVTLRHAEVLNPDGTLYTANLRSAQATNTYTKAGDGTEVYEPSFTFHGFRYVEVTGYPGEPDLDAVTGRVLHTAAPFTAEFTTSNPMLDQLQSNIVWGQRGNFLSVPTDTPARDERLGWTGDINVFAGTAAFNMDVTRFLSKWLTDLRDAQSVNGAFPDVAPRVCCGDGVAGWGDAGVTVPWTLWQRYGDTRVIADNYDAMAAWVAYMEATSNGLIRPNFGYGDWLNLDDDTNRSLLGTAYFAHSARLLADMAEAIGRDDDAAGYRDLAADVTAAFNDAYVAGDGRIHGDTQTAYVLALAFDLLPDDLRDAAASHLVERIADRDWHLSTGFLGTPHLLPVLTDTGHVDVAYRLLLNETYPSWGYQINLGATTMWERWDSIRPDGSFQDPGMNSFNHYAYGAVGDWMYATIAGLSPAEPGYRHSVVKPRPGGGLGHASASYDSVYGRLASAWRMDGDAFELDVTVPVNTTATVHVPAEHQWAVTEGGVLAAAAEGVEPAGYDDGYAVFEVGSGSYAFATAGPVLGALGGALHAVGELQDRVAELRSGGGIARGPGRHLDTQASKLAEQVGGAVDAHANDDDGTVGRLVQHGLMTTEQLRRWLAAQARSGVVDDAVADDLTDRVGDVAGHLSDASAALFGAVGALHATPTDVLPGDPVRVEATLENTGVHRLTDVDVTLRRPDAWTVRPLEATRAEALAPGESFTAVFEATPPAGHALGPVLLEAEASYRRRGGVARMPLATQATVVSPVTIASLTADRASVEPGDTATLTATLRNRSDAPADADVVVTAPAGWAVAPETTTVTLDGGEQHDVTITAAPPVEVSEGPAEVDVVVLHAGDEADRASTSLPVVFDNPPAEYHDHVDAGNPESEAAHNVQASPTSATQPPEAGHTRRYTHIGVPDAYFQYDMAVEPGEPFVVRAVETYDGPQIKDYYVYVNGVRVHERDHQRTASGAGTVTYQFVVDDVSLTADGVVTVRFQEDEQGANYDPSIADVWTTPVP